MKLMMKKSIFATASIFLLLIASTAIFQNCSPPDISSAQPPGPGQGTNIPSSTFRVSPESPTIYTGDVQNFSVSGGQVPYSFKVLPEGCGSVTNTSTQIVFTAPTTSKICTLVVKDAAALTARATIAVADRLLQATYSPSSPAPGVLVSISVSGGTPPYSFVKESGGGNLVGSNYTAPGSAETAKIKITDARSSSIVLDIVIGSGGSPGGGGGTIPIFRSLAGALGDFLHTRNRGEASPTYADQGLAFNVFTSGGGSRKQIHRCFSGRIHFVSDNCAGSSVEDTWFIEAGQTSSATKALIACNAGIQLATINSGECAAVGGSPGRTLGFTP